MAVSQPNELTPYIRPVRRIGRGYRGVRGRMLVHDCRVSFESSLERDLLEIIEHDQGVLRVVEQPFRIPYTDRAGRRRTYVPDFLTLHMRPDGHGTRGYLYEVKHRADLWANWPTLKPKLRAGRAFARARGLRFVIMTEVEIRGTYLENVKVLNAHRGLPPDGAFEARLEATLVTMGEATPRRLVEAAWNGEEPRRFAVPYILRLIALDRIQADLGRPLTLDSPIWIHAGEGFLSCPYSYQSNPV